MVFEGTSTFTVLLNAIQIQLLSQVSHCCITQV